MGWIPGFKKWIRKRAFSTTGPPIDPNGGDINIGWDRGIRDEQEKEAVYVVPVPAPVEHMALADYLALPYTIQRYQANPDDPDPSYLIIELRLVAPTMDDLLSVATKHIAWLIKTGQPVPLPVGYVLRDGRAVRDPSRY